MSKIILEDRAGTATREEDGNVTVKLDTKIPAFKKLMDPQDINELGGFLSKTIEEATAEPKPTWTQKQDQQPRLTIDMNGVEFTSTSALGKLRDTDKEAKRAGFSGLTLLNVAPEIVPIFEITNLDKVFEVLVDDKPKQTGHAR